MPTNAPPDGFEKTIEKYKSAVYGTALAFLRDRGEADDVFQEVFLLYFTQRPSISEPAALRTWLVRAAVNICRRHNSSSWSTRIDKTAEPDISRIADLSDPEETAVLSAVMSLDEKYRLPIYFHYFLGMPPREIASLLGIKSSTVSMRLSRAKTKLRKQLEGDIL